MHSARDVLPVLRDELLSHRHASARAAPGTLVFPTSSGSRRDKDNTRERVIRPVVAYTDARLAPAFTLRVYARAMRSDEGD